MRGGKGGCVVLWFQALEHPRFDRCKRRQLLDIPKDTRAGNQAIHPVSEYGQALTLGQVRTDEKSNQAIAIPRVPEMQEPVGAS